MGPDWSPSLKKKSLQYPVNIKAGVLQGVCCGLEAVTISLVVLIGAFYLVCHHLSTHIRHRR